ncbi:DUF4185 domain-containing protein [Tessaracoccus antarcticus]|uniref:DUF4185 domain-containing protein n=1 Tax=Tessaracoccus antarcticus TaxID=2479848 RepID=A0A3M0GGP5_9ACTN|nr:DUF4185 domain-containing protein [Tessaracoccus antarcticus]RMB61882.1 DUF4185 domain-containing protein [Tessaracoccus antarcticus]
MFTLVRNRFLILAAGVALAIPVLGAPHAQADDSDAPISPAILVDEVTGADATTDTTTPWDVGATDLGVIWDDGDDNVLVAFGDTFSTPGGDGAGVGNWRSNVLFRSSDHSLADGMTFDWALSDDSGVAKEIVGSKKIPGDEHTTIPTGGIAVDGRQYMAYMSVKEWGLPGQWRTNFSQLAYSDDAGATWSIDGAPRWDNNADGTDPFQMVAYVHHGDFVYMFGTPNGRVGAASLARVPATQMLDKAAYRYWNGADWSADYATSAQILPPAVAELSVHFDEASGLWQLITLNGNADLVLRVASAPEGPWCDEQLLASQAEYPGLYGGYIHPWSADGQVYFLMSVWNQYNVALMKVTLDDEGMIIRPNLLVDPSFERSALLDVPGGWRATGTGGIDTNQEWAKVGRRQFWVRGNQGEQLMAQQVSVTPNTQYQLTGWLKTGDTVGGGAGEGRIGARGVGPGATVVEQETFADLDGWHKFSVTFDSGSLTKVEVYAGSTMTGDRWVQGDNFSLQALSDPGPEPTQSPTPSPSQSASPRPTQQPSTSPTASPQPSVSQSTPGSMAQIPYEVPGIHHVNGRWWYTTCEPYSQTMRCRTEIWGTQVHYRGPGNYVAVTGWQFNNLTYLPFMPRSAWAGNPLGVTGEFTSQGRQWRTECDTPATGRNGCRSSIWMNDIAQQVTRPDGSTGYELSKGWVFNNIVRFGR